MVSQFLSRRFARLLLTVGLVTASGVLTVWAASVVASQTSATVMVDGRTWTSGESEGVSFSSRPVTGLVFIVE